MSTDPEYCRLPLHQRMIIAGDKEEQVVTLLEKKGVTIYPPTNRQDKQGIDGWYFPPGRQNMPQAVQIKCRRAKPDGWRTDILFEVLKDHARGPRGRLANCKHPPKLSDQLKDPERLGRDFKSSVHLYFLMVESPDLITIYQLSAPKMKTLVAEALLEAGNKWRGVTPFFASNQICLRPTYDPSSREPKLIAFIPLSGQVVLRKWQWGKN